MRPAHHSDPGPVAPIPPTDVDLQQRLDEARDRIQELERDLEAQRAAGATLERVLAAALDAVIVIDASGAILAWNGPAERIFGWSAEEVVGRPRAENNIPADHRAAHHRGLQRFLATGEGPILGRRIEVAALRRTGERFPVELAIAVLPGPGAPIFCAFLRDITEQKRAEEGLRASEEKFMTAFRASPDAITLSSLRDGRILEVNDGFEALSGWSRDEAVGRTTFDLGLWFDPADRDRLVAKLLAEGTVRNADITFVAKAGDLIHCLVSAELIELGGESCFLAVSRDISGRRDLERQLREAQKLEAVGQLAGGIAHDFNNLLTAIRGYADLALLTLEPGETRDDIKEIAVAAGRAAGLTRQLLAFARRQVLEPRVVDVGAQVRSLERMLHRLIGEDVVLATEVAPDLWPALVDPGQLEQVLMNLAVNARDAMPGGGRLVIACANVRLGEEHQRHDPDLVLGEYVALTVRDEGDGMTPETLARAFEPFFTTKEPGKGTGLGLATCLGIVKQAGGHICAESLPGEGTSVLVCLPRATGAVADRAERRAPSQASAGRETILVVEDEPQVRALVARTLRAHGYTVLDAGDGPAGLARAASHPGAIHLLVADVVMPGMSGKDLADALLRDRPGLPVLFVSGYTDERIGYHGVLDEGTDLLLKPFTPAALAARVREALDRSG